MCWGLSEDGAYISGEPQVFADESDSVDTIASRVHRLLRTGRAEARLLQQAIPYVATSGTAAARGPTLAGGRPGHRLPRARRHEGACHGLAWGGDLYLTLRQVQNRRPAPERGVREAGRHGRGATAPAPAGARQEPGAGARGAPGGAWSGPEWKSPFCAAPEIGSGSGRSRNWIEDFHGGCSAQAAPDDAAFCFS
ncbi:hypothetical protein GCM10010512_00110 [Streptomyces thermoviolaceus subsp. thermoviolaceus]|nr:hypothetical protein GCM10010512_00110 [Streptomyces thermoviolaceus subsp. thermoviolaceus]